MYSEIVIDHYNNPRFRGKFEGYTHQGKVGNPACGPFLHFYLRVAEGVIEQGSYETFGCPATIAAGSVLLTMVVGMKSTDAVRLKSAGLLEELGGLPRSKRPCADRAICALRLALCPPDMEDW